MRQCQACSAGNSDSSTVCGVCGASLLGEEKGPTRETIVQKAPQVQESMKGKGNLLGLMIGVVLGAGVLAGGLGLARSFGLVSFSRGVVVNMPVVIVNIPVMVIMMFGVGIIIGTIVLGRSVFPLSQVRNPIDGRVRRREKGERLRMDYVVSGIIMFIPATGFAVFVAWSRDDSVFDPAAGWPAVVSDSYWTVLVLTLVASTILYLAGSMLTWKGIRDPGYVP